MFVFLKTSFAIYLEPTDSIVIDGNIRSKDTFRHKLSWTANGPEFGRYMDS